MKLIFGSIFFTLLFISMMIYLLMTGNRVIERHNQLLSVITAVRSEVMQGALQLDGIASGFHEDEPTIVLNHFNNADSYLKSVLRNEEHSVFRFSGLTEVNLNQDINELYRHLNIIRSITTNRIDDAGKLLKNTGKEYLFDDSYDSFLLKLNGVESKFNQQLNKDKMEFKQTGYFLLLASLIEAVIIIILLYRRHERDKKQKLEITKIH